MNASVIAALLGVSPSLIVNVSLGTSSGSTRRRRQLQLDLSTVSGSAAHDDFDGSSTGVGGIELRDLAMENAIASGPVSKSSKLSPESRLLESTADTVTGGRGTDSESDVALAGINSDAHWQALRDLTSILVRSWNRAASDDLMECIQVGD